MPQSMQSKLRMNKPTALQKQLISLAENGMAIAGVSLSQISRDTGMSKPYVTQLMNGSRAGTVVAWDLILRACYGAFRPELQIADTGVAAHVESPGPQRGVRQRYTAAQSVTLIPASKRFQRG